MFLFSTLAGVARNERVTLSKVRRPLQRGYGPVTMDVTMDVTCCYLCCYEGVLRSLLLSAESQRPQCPCASDSRDQRNTQKSPSHPSHLLYTDPVA